jgi:hypothetical protein
MEINDQIRLFNDPNVDAAVNEVLTAIRDAGDAGISDDQLFAIFKARNVDAFDAGKLTFYLTRLGKISHRWFKGTRT